MIFHSYEFLIFIVLVFTLYWLMSHRAQNLFLLGASLVFYGWVHPWFLYLMCFSMTVDYYVAKAIEDYPNHKKRVLYLSLFFNLGLLGIFKYYNFFTDNLILALGAAGLPTFENTVKIILPVGISFYTFQSLSYTIDVYRGDLRACRRLTDFALFVSFFPQLVAGPIERATHLMPQFLKPRQLTPERLLTGFYLMIWGFFKKLVIADNVAITANKIFALQDPSTPMLAVGVFAFCIQIYADFSAYTDIARGCGRIFGFDICENFNHPYFARNPVDFWRRWHISLSTWFRDYVYIPLGGNRMGEWRTTLNIMITFVLSGFWHGASWNFIIWGFYHGLLIVTYRFTTSHFKSIEDRVHPMVQIAFMFFLTNIGWLIFRETDTAMLFRYFTNINFNLTHLDWLAVGFLFINVFIYSTPLWAHALFTWGRTQKAYFQETFAWPALAVRSFASVLLFLGILIARSQTSSDFIYFQF